jgi:CDP-6-deoxy-D-xylo-4-hexulose-3-dehydrase
MNNYSLASSTWDHNEIAAINEVVESGQFSMGERVKTFEANFATYIGSKFAVMVNSGSSANLTLLSSLKYLKEAKLKAGDEIIVPAVSWSTTFYPVDQIGCVLKFVDVNPFTLNIDVTKIEQAINNKTRAIFGVNLLGNPADWKSLQELASKHNLILLEDNCESLGADIDKKMAGTFGIGGTFSTFFSHHISTMEGGLISTDDEGVYQTMKSVRAHGWTRDLPDVNHVFNKSGNDWEDSYRFVIPGYNLRPLEIEAAIGIEQLKKLPMFIAERKNNAKYFVDNFKNIEGFQLQEEFGNSSWFGFALILTGKLSGKRANFVNSLRSASIESRPVVTGNFTRNPVIKHLNHAPIQGLPAADMIHDHGLFVGNHHFDLRPQIDRLLQVATDFKREN